MQIEKDKVVQFIYTLSDAEGQVLEKSDPAAPVAYLHGYDNLMAGIEKAMAGKAVGDQFSITLSAEEAYGSRRPDAQQRIPVKHLQGAKTWRPGMIASVQTDQGQRQVTVVKAGKFMITVDTNHPYAGKKLTFDIEVMAVREATAEELTHGHAHGVGGHQH